ncbi:MAG: DUF2948 family protein [Alphaproteobacteria bacterium]|jgi:hypothetical protein|nr:DUF2948 family protein [Alphaproteobacteria bacterium]|tara:strand:+ start:106 stop:558 length:453 start_codon:yes stop_codon:yes gene_type:complete
MINSLLRLRAEEAADLEVISTCLQDAIARVDDMTYIPRLRRFAMVVTRFRWELADEMGDEGGLRVRCGVHFDDVLRVRAQGIDLTDRAGLLPLLAITCEAADYGIAVQLQFGGGGSILLEAETVTSRIGDIDQGWPTPSRPDHGLDHERV